MHLKQRHPHLQVVLSIGGSTASEVFPIVASSTLLRDNFARSALGLVEASGLDGIDSEYKALLDDLLTHSCIYYQSLILTHSPSIIHPSSPTFYHSSKSTHLPSLSLPLRSNSITNRTLTG